MAAYNPIIVSTSITRSGTLATFTFTAHGFREGATVTITGAVPAQYNGTYVISGVAANTFNYTMASDPGSSATVQGVAQIFNVDDFSVAAANDTLTIDRGAELTINTNQTRIWTTITGTQGKLKIVNTSTTNGIRFLMGRQSGTQDTQINLNTSLFTLEVEGNWIELGVGNGGVQDFTSPFPLVNSFGYDFLPYIWVETAPGSGLYTAWANATWSYGGGLPFWREGMDALCACEERGRWFRQLAYDETTIPVATQPGAHFQNVLRFGEAYPVPTGCKVRVPNIMLTSGTLINLTNEGSTFRSHVGGNAGVISMKKCLMDVWNFNTPSPTNFLMEDCGMTMGLLLGTCYNTVIKRCGFQAGRQYVTYDTSVTPNYWRTIDQRNRAAINITSAPNGVLENIQTTGEVIITNSPEILITNLDTNNTIRRSVKNGLNISNSSGAIVNGLKCFSGRLRLGNQSKTRINDVLFSMGMFNEVVSINGSQDITGNQGIRIGKLPRTGAKLVNGTPYYFKVRTFHNWYDRSFYLDCPVTYSATPFQGRVDAADNSDVIPYWFAVAPWAASGVWQVICRWSNQSSILPHNSYRIFRSTVQGDVGTQISTNITTSTTTTYADTTVVAGTTYYYTLRYYRDATNYFDSAQQIVMVPADLPVAPWWTEATNICLQSYDLSSSPWANTGTAPTTSANSTYGPRGIITASSTGRQGCAITFAAGSAGGRQQTITVTNGQVYNFSWDILGRYPTGQQVVLTATSGANTVTQTVTLSRQWQRFGFDITAAATTLVISITSNATSYGTVVWAEAQVTLGSGMKPHIPTTTASVTAKGFAELISSATTPRVGAFSKGEGTVIELGNSFPSTAAYVEVYCDDTPGFTPSNNTLCASMAVNAQTSSMVFLDSVTDDVVIDGVTTWGMYSYVSTNDTNGYAAPLYISAGYHKDVILKNWTIDCGYFNYYLVATQTGVYWDNITLSDWTVTNSRGYGSYLVQSQLACNNTILSDVILDNEDVSAWNTSSAVSSNLYIRGTTHAWAGVRTDTVNALAFNAVDGVTKATVQLDNIFQEAYLRDVTKGLLVLTFSPSAKASPPYAITGSAIRFDNGGKLYFGTADEYITYTWPWRIRGITGFRNAALSLSTSALGSHVNTGAGLLIEYSLSDDGIIWPAFKELTYANTSTETIVAEDGFFLKIRLTPKLHMRTTSGLSTFVQGETIRNGTSTATAVVERVVYDPGSTTVGTIWVSGVTGTWLYNDTIWSGATQRATMNGDTTFGPLFPYIQVSYIDALVIPTVTDRAYHYPAAYSPVVSAGVVDDTRISVYNDTTKEWLETNRNGTTTTVMVPWFDDFTARVKYRMPGYKFQDIVVALDRFGYHLDASQEAWTRISGADPGAVSITLTDHETSPVTWQGKQWRFTIQATDSSDAAKVAQWFYWHTGIGTRFDGHRASAMPALVIEDSGTGYETQLGAIDGDGLGAGGCRILNSAGDAMPGFSRMQSNDGSYYVAPVSLNASITGFVAGTGLVVHNETTDTYTYNAIVAGTSWSASYIEGTTYTAGDVITVYATYVNGATAKRPLKATTVATSGGWAVSLSQQDWTEYNTVGIAGADVIECTTDYANIQVDVDDSDDTTTKARLAAFIVYAMHIEATGRQEWFDALYYKDSGHAVIRSAVATINIDNIKTGSKLKIIDTFHLNMDNGASMVENTTNTIVWDNSSDAVIIETGTSGLTTQESELLTQAANLSVEIETGKTAAQLLRLQSAVLLGKSSGQPGSLVYRDVNDTADRVAGTVDGNGNRTAVTLTP